MELRDQLQATLGTAYSIEEELSGGGMSRVFVAEERALGRRVVVKVLHPDLGGAVNIDRFRREIRMAARLRHPHIVPVLTAGELDGMPYYTMPLEDGQSLRGRLAATGPLSITDTMAILGDVAKALSYAHSQGVVHRDIKPDNVLVCGDAAVVTDFGIAKALSDAKEPPAGALTQEGMTMGTPAYMAPEQAAADPTMNHRADIYAVGCLAYELLTGRPPFVDASPRKLLAAQLSELPQPVSQLRRDTPAPLAALVMRCLEKEPDRRPQHAMEIVRVLEALATGEHVKARTGAGAAPPAPRQRLGRILLVYGLAFIPVAMVAKATMITLGLPPWVLTAVMAVMVLALPIVVRRA